MLTETEFFLFSRLSDSVDRPIQAFPIHSDITWWLSNVCPSAPFELSLFNIASAWVGNIALLRLWDLWLSKLQSNWPSIVPISMECFNDFLAGLWHRLNINLIYIKVKMGKKKLQRQREIYTSHFKDGIEVKNNKLTLFFLIQSNIEFSLK